MGYPWWKATENPRPRNDKKVDLSSLSQGENRKGNRIILGIDVSVDFLCQSRLLLCSLTQLG